MTSLFHPKTLATFLNGASFPADLDERHAVLLRWVAALKSGTLDEIKEVSLHGQFLGEIFGQVLGYRTTVKGEGTAWELHAEHGISGGGGSADGALGFFSAVERTGGKVRLTGRVIAPIELKGAKNDLDRPAPGRRESAVEQGWRYANYTAGCRWVIVSNYREIRLYHTRKTPAACESFRLEELARPDLFRRFWFLLCRENFLPPATPPDALSLIDQLLTASDEAEEEVTRILYAEYRAVRLAVVEHFLTQFSSENAPLYLAPVQSVVERGEGEGVRDGSTSGSTPLTQRLINRTLSGVEGGNVTATASGSRSALIAAAQKVMDRFLFVAFCEDRGLLPDKALAHAHDHRDPYQPRPIWDNYRAIFRWVNEGNPAMGFPAYNGGLFAPDPLLDGQLTLTDDLCTKLKELTRFDFAAEVSVDILGHIFEQSITDLEELKARAEGRPYDERKGTRKSRGVFYTPAFITHYMVETALGGYLRRREARLRQQILDSLPATASAKTRLTAEIRFWETCRDEVLRRTRIIDISCGSGAFLIAAFDYLTREYRRVNDALAALTGGQGSLFDLNVAILTENLFGVDLSPESVEITRLSLWLKTAEKGKPLTALDRNIRVGNSIVDDPAYDERAFVWEEEFPEVFNPPGPPYQGGGQSEASPDKGRVGGVGGFDVVVGNPPYVRQELLSPIKPYLQKKYAAYDGVADLYTYFYEKGLTVLRPDGLLSYIVTNKWLRAGYGEPLRRFFAEQSIMEEIVDFGHAPIFEDADTFPCIIVARKPNSQTSEVLKTSEVSSVRVCSVPRERLPDINLPQYVQQESHLVPWSRFTAAPWSLEPPAVEALMDKIRKTGKPLKEFAGVKPYRGVLTGLNEAFVIDDATREKLMAADPNCAAIIKPFLRGQDIKRWLPEWQGLWLVLLKSSGDKSWPWSEAGEGAEAVFAKSFPSLYDHLKPLESALRKRTDKGRFWWELRSCANYSAFEQPKLIYQEIQFHSAYCYDAAGYFTNNKAFILANPDPYLLAVLTSPLIWWYNWRNLPHMKDEALSPVGQLMENLPIASPTDEIRAEVEPLVTRLIEITRTNQEAIRDLLDWLRVEFGIEKTGGIVEALTTDRATGRSPLQSDVFVAAVKKQLLKKSVLTLAQVKALRQTYTDYSPPLLDRTCEAREKEHRLADLVNQAYDLTPEEVNLLWKTAPPRMPGSGQGC